MNRRALERAGFVRLAVYDTLGRLLIVVDEGWSAAGSHLLRWDGRDRFGRSVRPGAYFARLEHAGSAATRRLVRVR